MTGITGTTEISEDINSIFQLLQAFGAPRLSEKSDDFAPTGLRPTAQGCRALTATLGKEPDRPFNRNAVAPNHGLGESIKHVATALRLRIIVSPFPG